MVVLGIHTPETGQEKVVANVRREAKSNELKFPIVVDNDKKAWDGWANRMWPSTYLIDKRGYIRFWWYGELNWQGNEGEKMLRKRIEQLLAEP